MQLGFCLPDDVSSPNRHPHIPNLPFDYADDIDDQPQYLDMNRTHPFVSAYYYFYKNLLHIIDTGVIFSVYHIDYDVDYFLLNEDFNEISALYLNNAHILNSASLLLNNINDGSLELGSFLFNTDELLLDLNIATLY